MHDHTDRIKPATPPVQKWVGTRKLAERLGISPATVRALAKAGTIPAYLVGRVLRFDPSEVEAALRWVAPHEM